MNIKQVINLASLIFASILFSMLPVNPLFAQDPACNPNSNPPGPLVDTSYCLNQSEGPETNNEFVGPASIANTVVTVISIIAGVAAVIGVIIGGFMYVFSSGDPSKTARAKDTIIYSIVGLIIVILARQIVMFVLNRL